MSDKAENRGHVHPKEALALADVMEDGQTAIASV
jgi:hypothetical protein